MLAFDSGNEGTTNDLIKDFDTKFAMAVDAGYVLALLRCRCRASSNMDLLVHFAARAFNRLLISRDSGDTLQSGNQFSASGRFGHKTMRPGPRSGLESRTLLNC